MNPESASLDHRLLSLLHAVRETHDGSARATLNDLLRSEPAARAAMARLLVDEQALIHHLRDAGIVSLLDPVPVARSERQARPSRWATWRPFTAATAGVVLGTLSTSLVYGLVTNRVSEVRAVPQAIFDSGLESAAPLHDGLPDQVGRWGADDAQVVPPENGVSPSEGSRMLRLEPIPRDKEVKNHTSRAYQVLDLRSLPEGDFPEDAEVQVTASFIASRPGIYSRYLIRAVALDEAVERAMENFWSKVEGDGAVSVSRRFESVTGRRAWQTFSLRMPLPRGAQTLVLILGAMPPEDPSTEASVHYLDDVRVSLLLPAAPLP